MNLYPEHAHTANTSASRSPRRSIQSLPVFYVRTILKPSKRLFAQAAEYAHWKAVWLQLGLLLVIPLIIGLLKNILRDTSTGINTHANIFFGLLDAITVGATIGAFFFKLILVPLLFFIEISLQYLIAKLFKGQGSYVSHAYSMLLYKVPLALLGGILITIFVALHFSTLFFAPIISLVLFCYGIFINIFVVMGVHNLNRDKSIVTVAIPYILGVLAISGIILVLAHYLATVISNLH